METSNSIDTYFTALEKYETERHLLSLYEEKGVKLTMSTAKFDAAVKAEIPRIERETVDRGYDRLMRDLAKLTTDAGRRRKAQRFISELEFYYPRLQKSTVAHINGLREDCRYA